MELRGGQLPEIQTVFIIVMENHSWPAIKGNASAPYINGLLTGASYCENYQNVPGLHPSLPNYLWLEAGTNFGITNDSDPSVNHQRTTNHFVAQLERAGISWKSYQEDISGTKVPLTSVNGYAPKHNPCVYFDDVTGTNNANWPSGIAHNRPFAELATDLANNTVARYNFITPNLCDDMHDSCSPLYNSVRQGDNWLAAHVPGILASPAFTTRGALFITWDESSGADTHIGMILLSPLARGGGYASTGYYTHSSMLLTLQSIFHVGPLLGDAANATDLSDLFAPVAPPTTPLSIDVQLTGGSNAVQLTAAGVNTNQALVLEWTADFGSWMAISTNTAPAEGCAFAITNGPGSERAFYRLRQAP